MTARSAPRSSSSRPSCRSVPGPAPTPGGRALFGAPRPHRGSRGAAGVVGCGTQHPRREELQAAGRGWWAWSRRWPSRPAGVRGGRGLCWPRTVRRAGAKPLSRGRESRGRAQFQMGREVIRSVPRGGECWLSSSPPCLQGVSAHEKLPPAPLGHPPTLAPRSAVRPPGRWPTAVPGPPRLWGEAATTRAESERCRARGVLRGGRGTAVWPVAGQPPLSALRPSPS